MPGAWNATENEAVAADYFEMFDLELRGVPYIKAAHNRALQKLTRRSHGSIEMKHQNISAVLRDLGCTYIDGYKPLPNYQDALFYAVDARVRADPALVRRITAEAEAGAAAPPLIHILDRLVPAPSRRERPKTYRERLQPPKPSGGASFDYAEREARNSALGTAGEHFVLDFERERLRSQGREQLVERVEHVAVTEGPSAGFDIRSFEANGRDRLIEVKTTGGPRGIAFFVSKNELNTSKKHAQSYHLYRPFNFRRDPHLFIVRGALNESCLLEADQYRAVVA